MKNENIYKEKNKLPLTFKYMEVFRKKNITKNYGENVVYFIPCQKYQTNFYTRQKPLKPLIRML